MVPQHGPDDHSQPTNSVQKSDNMLDNWILEKLLSTRNIVQSEPRNDYPPNQSIFSHPRNRVTTNYPVNWRKKKEKKVSKQINKYEKERKKIFLKNLKIVTKESEIKFVAEPFECKYYLVTVLPANEITKRKNKL